MAKPRDKTNTGLKSLQDLLVKYDLDKRSKYITREFQNYGYRLALALDDLDRISLYMKLSKVVDRSLLETAKNFVVDAGNVKNKSRLFMWKLNRLKQLRKSK